MKKINDSNILFVNLQLIFSVVTAILLLWFVFDKRVVPFFEIFLGLSLITMGINNHLIYKRKHFTVLYIVIGVFILISTFLSIIGV
ncbi:MAG: hypothetical protein IJ193_02525 [Bacilli bacterium]|nr:hypothetical protein [Bacilli bacterium]